MRCTVISNQYRQAQVFVCDSYGRSRLRFGISGLHGGGRVAFSSVRFAVLEPRELVETTVNCTIQS